MPTHYIARDLPQMEGSRVKWSLDPDGTAVIFVHGFGGHATDTWRDFPTALANASRCSGADLIFFSYDSLRSQVPFSAAQLRDFLNRLETDPANSFIKPSVADHRRSDDHFRYRRVLLIGHSLGAVVIREALVQAAMDPVSRRWLGNIAIGLFAPAHKGARILDLASDALGAVKLTFFKVIARGALQVLDDLEPESAVLKKLEEDTATLIRDQVADCFIAGAVVQGQRDQVVGMARFCQDPGPIIVTDKGHTDICKPKRDYRKPVEIVESLL